MIENRAMTRAILNISRNNILTKVNFSCISSIFNALYRLYNFFIWNETLHLGRANSFTATNRKFERALESMIAANLIRKNKFELPLSHA